MDLTELTNKMYEDVKNLQKENAKLKQKLNSINTIIDNSAVSRFVSTLQNITGLYFDNDCNLIINGQTYYLSTSDAAFFKQVFKSIDAALAIQTEVNQE